MGRFGLARGLFFLAMASGLTCAPPSFRRPPLRILRGMTDKVQGYVACDARRVLICHERVDAFGIGRR
jgi:hypothetical protein